MMIDNKVTQKTLFNAHCNVLLNNIENYTLSYTFITLNYCRLISDNV